jgi:enoyl-CoA hydratase/carnithine racemase
MSVRTERDGHVLVVTIDRPEARNAINLAMYRQLIEVWRSFAEGPDLRVAVLTGTGDKAFCAGADLKEVGAWYASLTPAERRRHAETEPGFGGITRNLDPTKPVVAAINGACLAGGLELALACDVRIAAENATFGLPEVKWGLMPGAGGTQRLPRAIPESVAMEMLLTGDPIDAQTASRVGLVSRVVPPDALRSEAFDVAGRIARAAPLSTRAVRKAVRAGRDLALDDGLRLEQSIAEPLRQSEDVQEGLRAFREKRDPEFRGR